MAIDFPTSPTVGQQVTSGSRTWSWSGSHWTNNTITGVQGLQGIQGVQGTQGIQGTQGTQGIQGISGASILGLNNTFTGVNSINIDGTVGATTASTGSFTTVAASGNVTLNNATIYGMKDTGGTFRALIQLYSDNNVYIDNSATGGSNILTRIAGSTITQHSSTGLAVTGNGSFTATQPTLSLVATGGTNSSNLVFTPAAGYDAIISTSVASKLIFKYNSTEVARIDSGSFAITGTLSSTTGANFATSSGSVGIGTTSPAVKLDIIGTTSGSLRMADNATDATNKVGRIVGRQSTNADTDFLAFDIRGLTTSNEINYGGGSGILNSATSHTFYTAANKTTLTGTVRMIIDSSGNVGIGTASPAATLDVFNPAGSTLAAKFIHTQNDLGGGVLINTNWPSGSVNTLAVTGFAGAPLLYVVASGASGNVGIGTTSPATPLHISKTTDGGIRTTVGSDATRTTVNYSDGIYGNRLNASSNYVINTTAGALYLQQDAAGNIVMVGGGGNVGIGTASPDQPLAFADSVGTKIQFNGANANGYQLGLASAVNGGDAMMKFTAGETGAGEFGFYNTTNARLFINNSGNVGIGTTSPQNKLHVINGSANSSGDGLTVATLHVTGPNVLTTTSNATLIVATNDALGIDIGGSIGFAGRYSGTSQFTAAQISGRKEDATSGNYGGYLAFCTRANGTQLSEKVRISGSGNVQIGSTAALGTNARLDITSAGGEASVLAMRYTNSVAGKLWEFVIDSNSRCYFVNQAFVGVYINDGDTSWTAYSDERFKTDLQPIEDSINKVCQLRAVTGRFKTDAEGVSRSFLIAQDVQTVFPEAVSAQNPDELGLRYSDMIPLMIAAIKELKAENNTLSARLAALEATL